MAVVVSGCGQSQRAEPAPIAEVWQAPPPSGANTPPGPTTTTSAPSPDVTSPRGSGPIVATVNGDPIHESQLVDALVASHGADLLEKLVLLAALRQRANSLGIGITEADVAFEHDDALRRIAAPLSPAGTTEFDRKAAEAMLDQFLTAKNLSRAEFRLRMQQNAYLRKLAERDVKVDDRELPQEYERAYGEKVQVRCIQVASPESARKVGAALTEGKDFELVARQMNENAYLAANGGALPPFTRYDDVPKLLRDAAFALQVGQVSSPIHENNAFFVIRLEKRFPPSNVGVDNVKDDLRKRIRDRRVRERMDELARDLFQAADIRIGNSELLREFRRRYPDAQIGAAGR